MPTNKIDRAQLLISAEESLQLDVSMQSNTNSENYTIQVSLLILNNLFILGVY